MPRRFLLVGLLWFAPLAAFAEEASEREVVVRDNDPGDAFEEPGGYGQPEWVDRSRASVTTKLYVLNPWETFVGLRSEFDVSRYGKTACDLTQEFEIGLPGRVEFDLENEVSGRGGLLAESEGSVGLRYAFATWDKLPLNPAIAATYHFRTGEKLAASSGGDVGELRLLLGQEFLPRLLWTANAFYQRAFAGGHDRQIGFTQDVSYLVVTDKLELGTEMRYANVSQRREHRGAANEFVIGPSVNWKPNARTVVSLAPLVGCTPDSPRVAILASVSVEFGGGEGKNSFRAQTR